MSMIIDARGLDCPQPVVLTKKALEKADDVTVIVDNITAQQNVSRLAESHGLGVKVEEKGDGIYLRLTRPVEEPLGGKSLLFEPTVLLIGSSTVGRGDDELGSVLMRSLLHTLVESDIKPHKIIFMNSGVKLVVRGSEVLDDLRALEKESVEILACGTCLGHFGLKDAVEAGRISNMYEITLALMKATKVVSI
ncbi:MAG: sulfurtransferase-like selenium metabolism protein YedF [Dehalococcoidia bacterium]|nr:sulfurtransferase-like selenium metabolism protein YedF [Dehalococcoidia bacterium]